MWILRSCGVAIELSAMVRKTLLSASPPAVHRMVEQEDICEYIAEIEREKAEEERKLCERTALFQITVF